MWSDPRQIMTGEPKGFPESLDVKHKSTEGDPQVFWPEQAEERRCHHRLTRRETEVRVRQDRGHTAGARLSENHAGPTSRAQAEVQSMGEKSAEQTAGGRAVRWGETGRSCGPPKPSDSSVSRLREAPIASEATESGKRTTEKCSWDPATWRGVSVPPLGFRADRQTDTSLL